MATQTRSIWDPQIVQRAVWDALRKLHPRTMARNPVMFVVLVGSVLTTLRLVQDIVTGRGNLLFELQITFWLWLTVLFANFAEAMAEGRGKAQADTLRRAKTETVAKRERADGTLETVAAAGAAQGRYRSRRCRRGHPGRRRHHRGRRLGGRERDYRRIGAGDSRVRRRSLRGHRAAPGCSRTGSASR